MQKFPSDNGCKSKEEGRKIPPAFFGHNKWPVRRDSSGLVLENGRKSDTGGSVLLAHRIQRRLGTDLFGSNRAKTGKRSIESLGKFSRLTSNKGGKLLFGNS